MQKKSPLISVITVTYNAASDIEATFDSVLKHRPGDFEYIWIDGNSTDETKTIAERYLNRFDAWLSEPDKGIPDALNKGVKLAKGKYVLFVLAGDQLIDLPYEVLSLENADLICFPVIVTGNIVKQPEVNNWLKIKNTIPHQGAFFKRTPNLFHEQRYKFFCDFAICQLYFKKKLSIRVYQDPVVAFHSLDGATSNKQNFKEVFTIVGDNYGAFYTNLSFLYWKFYGLLKRMKIKT